MDKQVVVSVKTVLLAFLFGIILYVLYRLGAIIGLIFIALLISISLEHTVKFFARQTFLNKPLPRAAAVIITYVLFLVFVIFIISIGIDPLITQGQKVMNRLINFAAGLELNQSFNFSITDILAQFAAASGGFFSATRILLNNITTLFTLFILSLYISLDWEHLKKGLLNLIPQLYKERVSFIINELETNVGLWLKGQLLLMVLIGVLSYLALVILGVDYPLALGLLAGILEVVPLLGPIVSGIVAALVALTTSPIKAVLVLVAFTLIQQLEGNIIVPKVMQKVSGFSPIVILLGLMIGSNLFGIVGAILAVPIMMILTVIIKEVIKDFGAKGE